MNIEQKAALYLFNTTYSSFALKCISLEMRSHSSPTDFISNMMKLWHLSKTT